MRDQQAPPEEPDPERAQQRSGRLGTTGAPALTGVLVVGLVTGWLLRPLSVWRGTVLPDITLRQVALLYFVAAVLGWVAWATHTALHRGPGAGVALPPHRAVNRLVLAKACALAGAAVAGGYLGHALSWIGIGSEVGGQRIAWSLLGAGGAALTVLAALLLERACRVRPDDDGDAPART